ncbi:MAG: hypothetical protein PHY09_03230 [Desulfuromonadaceae bacterium]|nr:hypothetical protein [Desulfuromonadaceae bacterium]MDD5104507.1 hypothetical protein [Desulfuromonadaceae bacterium]
MKINIKLMMIGSLVAVVFGLAGCGGGGGSSDTATEPIPNSITTISKTYTQGDMVGETFFYDLLNESVAKTSGALLQSILAINSVLYTDPSITSFDTFKARKLEADKALDTFIKYAAETEDLITIYNPKLVAMTALSSEDVIVTLASGPANKQIKTLMTTYGVNAKKAQLILNNAMAGYESAAWSDLAAIENQHLQTATLIKNGAGLALTVAGTVVTAGGITGAVGLVDASVAIISGADGIIKVTQSGMELAIGKEVTLPDGSLASMVVTSVAAVSDIVAFKNLPKLVKLIPANAGDNVGNIYAITSKVVDGFTGKTVDFGPLKVDIKNGFSVGSSVDIGYINGLIGGESNAPSTLPGTYKIDGVTTVVNELPESMVMAINILPAEDKVDQVIVAGTPSTPPESTTQKELLIQISPALSDADPVIMPYAFYLPLELSSSGEISYDYTYNKSDFGNTYVMRIWGSGSYDGTLLILAGSWTSNVAFNPASGHVSQEDSGTFNLQTSGHQDDPPAQTHATTSSVTQNLIDPAIYNTSENLNQTPDFRVPIITQLD